jgi:hypothetical protein
MQIEHSAVRFDDDGLRLDHCTFDPVKLLEDLLELMA